LSVFNLAVDALLFNNLVPSPLFRSLVWGTFHLHSYRTFTSYFDNVHLYVTISSTIYWFRGVTSNIVVSLFVQSENHCNSWNE